VIRAFVTGWPISHSLSPALHGHWLSRLGIDGRYEAVAVEPQAIGAFLRGLPGAGWAGGNVTIPHKEAALAACHTVTPEAAAIGAVNTVWIQRGRLAGTNTDAHGFAANLDQFASGWDAGRAALVLGAGGAARAIIHALASRGYRRIAIANRTPARAEAVAAGWPAARALPWEQAAAEIAHADLIVNTTSLGMAGQPPLDLDLAPANDSCVVTDIVYVPLDTPFLAAARARGLQAVDGLGMLLHQAAPGFERWFGHAPQVDADLRAAVLAALAARDKH